MHVKYHSRCLTNYTSLVLNGRAGSLSSHGVGGLLSYIKATFNARHSAYNKNSGLLVSVRDL